VKKRDLQEDAPTSDSEDGAACFRLPWRNPAISSHIHAEPPAPWSSLREVSSQTPSGLKSHFVGRQIETAVSLSENWLDDCLRSGESQRFAIRRSCQSRGQQLSCESMTSPLTSVELFTGAGGLALGVAAAGFEHRLLVEYNPNACASLRTNRRAFGHDCSLHEGDVREVDYSDIGSIDLLAAGAPCQPFSIGGKHRADRDERNLFPEVFRAVLALRPRAILVENVRGLLRPSLSEFVEYIELQLANPTVLPTPREDPRDWASHLPRLRKADRATNREDSLHYRVHRVLLNAADFGVPQKRERVFFVAFRGDIDWLWSPPEKSHSARALQIAQEITGDYWKRHGVNRRVNPGHPRFGAWKSEAGDRLPWLTVRDALAGLPEPCVGEETEGVANHVGQAGARSYPGHTGSPLDEPAKTLKAGVHGVPGGENMLRRTNGTVRYFTVREAARLQTFPDTYVFNGPWGEAMRQIGNAVPVRLAQAVAASIHQCLLPGRQTASRRLARLVAFEQAVLPGI
jgi:DNA (cytosine-5)-methyltransferase 1